MLFMVQHVLSEGATHYNRIIGSVVIIAVLCLVQAGVKRLGGLGGVLYALTYMPSLILLAGLTCVDNSFTDMPIGGARLWVLLALLVVYVAASLLLKFGGSVWYSVANDGVIGSLWKNLLCMAGMFLVVALCSNTDSTFHYRLRVERLLSAGSYGKALQVGEKSDDTDASLTMLRIYALSKSRQMGERLFEYPLVGGSSALLPDGNDVRCLYYPEDAVFKSLSIRKKGVMSPMEYLLYVERHGLALKPVADYILCGYLLDKDLDCFVSAIRHKYNLTSASLPKHYKEALTLYTHLRANPVLVYHSEVMDADYADFQKILKSYPDKREREAYVRDTYGSTYWFYYFFHDEDGGR